MNRKKRLGVLVLGVLGIMLITLGALKVTGYFNNPEAEALALLAQLPDKVSVSYEEEFLGQKALEKNAQKKGMATTWQVTGKKVNKRWIKRMSAYEKKLGAILPWFSAIEDAALSFEMDSDVSQGVHKATATLSKGKSEFHAAVYRDGEGMQYELPELFPGRVIFQGQTEPFSINQEQQQNKLMDFLIQEYEKTKAEIVCKRSRETGENYVFTISSQTLSVWLRDFSDYLAKEKEQTMLVRAICRWNPDSWQDLQTAFLETAEELSKEKAEYSLCVKGSEGEFTSVSFYTEEEKAVLPIEMTLSLSQEENATTVQVAFESKNGSDKKKWEITRQNKKSAGYGKSWDVRVQTERITIAVKTNWFLDPETHECSLEADLKWNGTKIVDLVAEGTVKDIVPGESIHYIWDDITLMSGNMECFSFSADCHKKLLDYKLKPLQGESIDITELTMEMKQEIERNKLQKIMEFGLQTLVG